MTSQFQIINKILQTKDYSLISLNNLTEDHFFNYRSEFKYICEHYSHYKVVPDRLTFVDTFTEFDIVDVTEPDSYLIEQLFADYNKSYLASKFNTIKQLIEKDDVDGAAAFLTQAAQDLHTGSAMTCTDIFSDTSRYDRYIDRLENHKNHYISTGFPELDKIIGGIDMKEENMVIAARTGQGKCLEKGTLVLMADGTTKKVEDVHIGDKVQSYNRINTVLDLHNGISNGYRIIPNVGKPFVISSNHILTLYKYDTVCKGRKTVHTSTGHLEDIMVEDFLNLSAHKQHQYKLFRPAVEYEAKEQLIDPYILGVWLGDGTSAYGQVCTADYEIADSLYTYAKANGMNFQELPTQRSGRAKLYSLTAGTGKSFQTLLRQLGVLNNKHIPLNYLTGDRAQRLSLLAGLLDTDGSYSYKIKNSKTTSSFEFVNKNNLLFDQILQLCRGLGFKTTECKPKKVLTAAGYTEYRRMHISGDLSSIPTKVERKRAVKTNYHSTNTGFKIEPVDRVEYYGFMCDGDSRYLLADNTLTHNTWTLLKIAVEAAKQGLTVGIYSGEMSPDKVGYRVDTLLGHIDNSAITRGNNFDRSVPVRYKMYLDSIKTTCPGTIKILTPNDINGPATVGALRTFVEKEKLNILLIDQYSLLEDQHHAKVAHERVANISKDVKNLQVMSRIPIISVSQMNRSKNEDGEQDTTQIGLSDRIGQDATTILMLSRDLTFKDPEKKQIADDRLIINIVKSRDGGAGKLIYKADFNFGNFIFLDPNLSAEESEDLKNYYEGEYEEGVAN